MSRGRGAAVGVVAIAALANILHRVGPPRARIASNLGAAAAALGMARATGASWSDLGLGGDPRRSARDGALAGLAAGGAVAVLAAAPPTRRWFVHERTHSIDATVAAYELGVRIPFETALAEELIFRGALLGLELRRTTPLRAIVTSSMVFGLWHVLPTLASLDGSSVAGHIGDSNSRRGAAVVATVAATSAAGLAFAVLRVRTKSVWAPVAAHAAFNAASFASSRIAATTVRRNTVLPSSRAGSV